MLGGPPRDELAQGDPWVDQSGECPCLGTNKKKALRVSLLTDNPMGFENI
jgi:hypothetical protein